MSNNRNARPVAMVTGCFRGIGRACALGLAQSGFDLLVNDLDNDRNREAERGFAAELADLGADSLSVLGDAGNLDLHAAMLDAAMARWGRVDCLVNNAGIPARCRGDLLDVQPDSFDACIRVNTRAVFFLCQAVARLMLSQAPPEGTHRSIVNITSSNAKSVAIARGEYCVSKAASSMTTKLFALRLAPAGIGVYEVLPGIIETEMTRPVKAQYDRQIANHLIPMERWGHPSDIASTVVCMAEGRLLYTVGQAIAVDGGLIMPHY
jgi:NAD(P)-dependent dehydrogenase (short-subunit alcohol dehydrogenase family)